MLLFCWFFVVVDNLFFGTCLDNAGCTQWNRIQLEEKSWNKTNKNKEILIKILRFFSSNTQNSPKLLESELMRLVYFYRILVLADKKTQNSILSLVRAILWTNFQVARSSRTKKTLWSLNKSSSFSVCLLLVSASCCLQKCSSLFTRKRKKEWRKMCVFSNWVHFFIVCELICETF